MPVIMRTQAQIRDIVHTVATITHDEEPKPAMKSIIATTPFMVFGVTCTIAKGLKLGA